MEKYADEIVTAGYVLGRKYLGTDKSIKFIEQFSLDLCIIKYICNPTQAKGRQIKFEK
jgi:hypothetical protein